MSDSTSKSEPELQHYYIVELSGSQGTIHLEVLARDWTLFEKFWALAEEEKLFESLVVKDHIWR